ncbi:MAG: hypothetical protein LC795_01180 [Acidobacteria bacterium]|nr:hypothetical protein [Acidobacteriota bacterium]
MGLLDDAKKAAQGTVDAGKQVVGAAKGAAEDTAGKAADTANEVADATKAAADKATDTAKEVAARGAQKTQTVVRDTIRAAVNNMPRATAQPEIKLAPPPQERLLTQKEKDLAWSVYRDTLPYGAIYLSNKLGAQERPYAIPHPVHLGSYVIHFGETAFDVRAGGATQENRRKTFIHELAHVWQGEHYGKTPLDYVCNSVADQAMTGGGTYDHTPGQRWNSYTVEQQASIVAKWFADGMKEDDKDKRWPYVRDTIRPAGKRTLPAPQFKK